MSLFVCMECGAIENTNCITRNLNSNPEYPNLHMMDMHGFSSKEKVAEVVSKLKGECRWLVDENRHIVMLCSECNTGRYHNEFEKMYATDEELALAHTSEYNMVTPFDHPELTIKKDDNCRVGYRLHTEEEIVARKKGKAALNNIMGISTIFGGSMLPKYFKDKNREQTEEEKTVALRKAELKREIKLIKRRNDPNAVSALDILVKEYNELKGK